MIKNLVTPPRRLVLLFLFMLSGCAGPITPVPQGGSVELLPEQGLLLLAIDTPYALRDIEIRGERGLFLEEEHLKKGRHYLLVPTEAGEYYFDGVEFIWVLDLEHDDRPLWSFRVVPGRTSYAGTFSASDAAAMMLGRFELINEASMALEYMEETFPELLARFPLVFTGVGEDDFYERLREATP